MSQTYQSSLKVCRVTLCLNKTTSTGQHLVLVLVGLIRIGTTQGADEAGNAITTGKDTIEVDIYKQFVPPAQDFDTVLPVHVVDFEDGRYFISYLATEAGAYIGQVHINGSTSNSLAFQTHVYPSVIDPFNSRLVGEAASFGTAGDPAVFHIQACDTHGNKRHFGGDRLTVVLRPMFGKQALLEVDHPDRLKGKRAYSSLDPRLIPKQLVSAKSADPDRIAEARCEIHAIVTSLSDGRYNVEYSTNTAGRYSMLCSYKNPFLRQTTVFKDTVLTIFPSAPFAPECIVSGSGLIGVEPRMLGMATIMMADRWGNYRSLDPYANELKKMTPRIRSRPSSAKLVSTRIEASGDIESDAGSQSILDVDFVGRQSPLSLSSSLGQFGNGRYAIEVTLSRVIDGRKLSGGAVTIGEATDTFNNWFASTGLDSSHKKHLPGDMDESRVKLYTASYR